MLVAEVDALGLVRLLVSSSSVYDRYREGSESWRYVMSCSSESIEADLECRPSPIDLAELGDKSEFELGLCMTVAPKDKRLSLSSPSSGN